jgi:starvation-inducible outer membrane lipoprotein
MTPYAWLQRWSARFTMAITMTVVLWGCTTVPRQYVRMAEPGTTLTALIAHPETYRGKVVLLGGTIIEEEENEQYLWLHVKNRPLDQDYVPHRPVDTDGPESGYYWVVTIKQQFPLQYRQWARITVVGQVTGAQRFETEPVLSLLYVRGWGMSEAHHGVWENLNPNYNPSVPGSIKKN